MSYVLPHCSSSKPLVLPNCSSNMSHGFSKLFQSSSLNCCTFLKLSVNPISNYNINTSLYQSTSVIRSSSSKLLNLLIDTSSQSNCMTSISKTICNSKFSVVCNYKTSVQAIIAPQLTRPSKLSVHALLFTLLVIDLNFNHVSHAKPCRR